MATGSVAQLSLRYVEQWSAVTVGTTRILQMDDGLFYFEFLSTPDTIAHSHVVSPKRLLGVVRPLAGVDHCYTWFFEQANPSIADPDHLIVQAALKFQESEHADAFRQAFQQAFAHNKAQWPLGRDEISDDEAPPATPPQTVVSDFCIRWRFVANYNITEVRGSKPPRWLSQLDIDGKSSEQFEGASKQAAQILAASDWITKYMSEYPNPEPLGPDGRPRCFEDPHCRIRNCWHWVSRYHSVPTPLTLCPNATEIATFARMYMAVPQFSSCPASDSEL